LLASTFFLCKGYFRFSRTNDDDGEQNGWEVECKIAEHTDNSKCRKRLAFAKHGGQLMVERKLRFWCLNVLMAEDRLAHRNFIIPADADLDSLASLDEALEALATILPDLPERKAR
jgi:hypothetical protein